EFADIAGLVKGASEGEALGNKFLSHIRMTDAVLHVVRCFDDENIIHVAGGADPARDIETVDLELIMADIEVAERRAEKAKKSAKGDKKFMREAEALEKLLDHLNEGKSARSYECDDEERKLINIGDMLSGKPVIYIANMDEAGFAAGVEGNACYSAVKDLADIEKALVLPVCAKAEEEIAQLSEEDKAEFSKELGISESGLDGVIRCSYSVLGLISFLTAGPEEVRAWTVKKGAKAPQAAGKIHSDMERGFIRAETVAFEDLKACGSMAAAREKGLIRSEGKDYVVKDGDVMLIRFNV
ncbi:MAG: redox-regulated ATPase YchF, partial [Oscillospiraceae bacterium]|nr:redox-regulated ATPase YchF [Oscillospiraceae bacterium]